MEMEQEVLTHDQKKAAEAAFRGLPFNPSWSEAARKVYDGLNEAMAGRGAGTTSADKAAAMTPQLKR